MFKKLFGKILDSNDKQISRLWPIVSQVNEFDEAYKQLTDAELRAKTIEFRKRVQEDGEALDDILPEAFAAVKNACRRLVGQRWEAGSIMQTWDMVPFDVQIIGGIVLHQGKIAEMKTGEGKTLVASMPLYLNALSGKGAHLVTVNDYLAKRDSEWMGHIYEFLGMKVGCIQHGLNEKERQQGYAADVTYGTNNEFGFDYLRDNLVPDLTFCVQRDLNFAIVDEVDSILIDEARTPLIISGQGEDSTDWYMKFAKLIPKLTLNDDYTVEEKDHAASLTEAGLEKLEKWMGIDNFYSENAALAHYLDSSLRAFALYHLDKEYVVKEGEVIIVDEFTGRLMVGRRFSEGLHQAIEAKEGVVVKKESQTLATITFQNYFRMYDKLAGMTGTAETEAEEFDKIYKLDVVAIPTHHPVIRQDENDLIYKNRASKFRAIAQDVKARHKKGQPVLVGTIAVELSEVLSDLFKREGIPHSVLNAKQHDREALIVAEAGKKGAVTIATNMAGRGTDIKLGGIEASAELKQEIIALGGLYVIGSERHEARRIDNQLRGRSGRQGEPGESRFFVALDDDLMRIFGGDRVSKLMTSLGIDEDTPIENGLVSRSIEGAQKRVEGYNFDTRKHLVEYDDVMNKQREVIYGLRRQILKTASGSVEKRVDEDGIEVAPPVALPELKSADLIDSFIEQLEKDNFADYLYVLTHQPNLSHIILFMLFRALHDLAVKYEATRVGTEWETTGLINELRAIIPFGPDNLEALQNDLSLSMDAEDLRGKLFNLALSAYQAKDQQLGELMRQAERVVLLRTIDQLWVNHLDVMDDLRQGIGLRGYGQQDPLVVYKAEAFQMFQGVVENIQDAVVKSIYRIGIRVNETVEKPQQAFKNVQEHGGELKSSFNEARQATSGKEETRKPIEKKGEYVNVGRNDPCPCGSGKKFKKCHGQNLEA